MKNLPCCAGLPEYRKPGSILIVGRRWFDKVNGNTYHSVTVYADGKEVYRVPFAYGYDQAYEQTAWDELAGMLGLSDEDVRRTTCRLWCQEHGVAYASEVSDVARKRDL